MQFDVPEFSFSEDFFVSHLSGSVRISRTPQGLLFQGDFHGDTVQECVRCLDEYHQDIHTDFEELFAFTRNNVTDSGLLVPEDGQVDLAPLLREYLLLELPIKPLCQPDCKGLCVICGANLNTTVCEHAEAAASV